MNVSEVLAYLTVFVGIPVNWYVTWRLWRLSRASPRVRVLHERAIVAVAVAVIVTVFGLIFLNNDMKVPPLDTFTTKVITRGTVLVVSLVAASYWLWIYRKAPR